MDLVHRVAFRYATMVIATLGVGETFENDLWRVHRFAHAIKVTHLENAGLKGKQCVEMTLYSERPGDAPMESQAMEFVMLAKRKESLSRMNQAMEEAKAAGFDVHKNIYKGVDVKPGNFQKLFIRGAMVTIEADYDGFIIHDIVDENNEPKCIARGKRSVGQFYRWVKTNARKLQSMSLEQISTAMRDAGIDHRYYCAMD